MKASDDPASDDFKPDDLKPDDSKLIIEGITTEGDIFRPSDWADRVSGQLATFKNQRMAYSPLLKPGVKNGHKCVIIDEQLKISDPALYQELLDFAQMNHLKMCHEIDDGMEEVPPH